ncbi:MAG TPA: D-alanyl-D-alanine carboxypeptidase/D-alanyl-D-alanine-endopeptidase [Planctomycetota bacterium]|nr:D-alanyl-D-alanine carboxypeptidase/D-alanyl-D-alanine-endopeptidase [Planctomycetota bacterium]
MRTPFLALLLAGLLPAQDKEKSLRDQIEAAVTAFKAKSAKLSIHVRSVKADAPLYALNDHELLMLASNTKLLTTSAALVRLGPEFKFRTSIGTAGPDLHVFAGGDPNLSGRFHDGDPTAIFRGWAAQLKSAGVAKAENLVLHGGIWDDVHLHPGWKAYDLWWWWSAPFGAFSFNDNCVDLRVEPAAEGEPARVFLSPDTAYVKLVNHTRSAARSQKPFGFTRAPGTNTITLSGDVPGKMTHSVAIQDPTMFFATVLRETLGRDGIEISGKIEESPELLGEAKGYREIASWESDLGSTLGACLQPSQNFYAEMILRTLGWKRKGRGTTENGLAAVREFLAEEPKLQDFSQADGSGLTRENRSTAADLVALLLYMRQQPSAKVFLDALPTSGDKRGTLRNRMLAPDVKGRVHAKTGHVGGVTTLSGYVEAAGGDTFAFSILVNAEEGGSTGGADRLEDRICEILARYKGD